MPPKPAVMPITCVTVSSEIIDSMPSSCNRPWAMWALLAEKNVSATTKFFMVLMFYIDNSTIEIVFI